MSTRRRTLGTKLALCIEQTLGHRAHTLNLEQATAGRPGIDLLRVGYRARGRLPLPWAVRGSMAACTILRQRPRADVTLFHTQSVGLFAPYATHGGKYIVSVDATPRQMDTMGRWYGHRRQHAPIEAAKDLVYKRVLGGASRVVAWSDWARDSLINDYGVLPAHTDVLHPGAPRAFFSIPRPSPRRRPTILFVGGDFERKGGPILLDAFALLRDRADLLVVTAAPVAERAGVGVVRDATPGSDRLISAYARADIFCLPTFGDCTSVAIEEAMAAGLPVVTTDVGSNASTVLPGASGLLVAPGSATTLAAALAQLVDDVDLRRAMGQRARERAAENLDAQENARRLVAIMEAVA